MTHVVQVIQAFVVPVVVISANGLLCLALYNRLAAVVSRARTIHKERFDLATRLAAMSGDASRQAEAEHVRRRLGVLDELAHQLLDRGRLVRDSLACLLLTVLAMIGCSLAVGVAAVWTWFEWVALGLFVAGMVVMALGIAKALFELRIALGPLLFEHDTMEHGAGG